LVLKTPPASRTVRCWDYQSAGGSIYQRVAGDGSKPVDLKATDWTVFKGAKAAESDLVNQLKPGDLATPKLQEITALATASPGDRPDLGQHLKGPMIESTIIGRVTRADLGAGTGSSSAATAVRRIGVEKGGKAFIETTAAGGSPSKTEGTARVRGDYLCLHVPVTTIERCFFVYKAGENKYAFAFPDLRLNSNFVLE
jgi:hypothetical protein